MRMHMCASYVVTASIFTSCFIQQIVFFMYSIWNCQELPILFSFCASHTVCALIFTGFNVRGFRGSAAIREYFIHEYLNIAVNGHVQLQPIDERFIRFVGVREATRQWMVECTLEMHWRGGAEKGTRWWDVKVGRELGASWEQDMVDSGVWAATHVDSYK